MERWFRKLEGIMGRIVAVANQKGGVGKTTTAVNLGASVAAAECKVLLVDMDPQANASSGLGVGPHEIDESVYAALDETRTIKELVKDSAEYSRRYSRRSRSLRN